MKNLISLFLMGQENAIFRVSLEIRGYAYIQSKCTKKWKLDGPLMFPDLNGLLTIFYYGGIRKAWEKEELAVHPRS